LDTTLKAFGKTTGKSGKALGESRHSLSLESRWTGKSSKKIDLNNLIIKFITSKFNTSFGEASTTGLANYSKSSLSSVLGGKSGKSGLEDKKEDKVHDLFDIFVSWLKSSEKKETIDAIFSRIVVDGSLLDGLDMFQLLDELQKELANLPPKSFLLSGKSGKSSPGHFVGLSSLFSGKSGKSGLEDKAEDILELLEDVLAQVVEVLLELLPSSQPSFQPSLSVFPSSQPSESAEPSTSSQPSTSAIPSLGPSSQPTSEVGCRLFNILVWFLFLKLVVSHN